MKKSIFYKINNGAVCKVDLPEDINININQKIKDNIKNNLAKMLNIDANDINETTKLEFNKVRL